MLAVDAKSIKRGLGRLSQAFKAVIGICHSSIDEASTYRIARDNMACHKSRWFLTDVKIIVAALLLYCDRELIPLRLDVG